MVIRAILLLLLVLVAPQLRAETSEFTGLARLDPLASQIADDGPGVLLHLRLSQGVAYRVFTIDKPARLVVDFRELEWRGVAINDLIKSSRVLGLRLGEIRPGWTRLVIDLSAPHILDRTGLSVDPQTGMADLRIWLGAADAVEFASKSGVPDLPGWDLPDQIGAIHAPRPNTGTRGALRVVIDPGHGGIDPGAQSGDTTEKDLMLQFAVELKETLLRDGNFEVILTRSEDVFISLERRVAIAHQAEADLFISLHADALSEARTSGASVYTLSDSASDEASAALAERHDRADILSGVDLSGQDDVVAGVLMDMARMETQPRAEGLARAIVAKFREHGLPLLAKPLRHAGFSVLKSPDIPSVLLEVGFLSSPRDTASLLDHEWRASVALALRDAMLAWQGEDLARKGLVRQ